MKLSKKAREEFVVFKKIEKIVKLGTKEAEKSLKLNFIPAKNFPALN